MAAAMVTDAQVKLLRRRRMQGNSDEAAAAAAGMTVPTARRWRSGPMPSHSKRQRHWRTRIDPFASVWETEILPLLDGVLGRLHHWRLGKAEDRKRSGSA
jgi:hypothetical protein